VEEVKEYGELVSHSSGGEKTLSLGTGGRPCRFACSSVYKCFFFFANVIVCVYKLKQIILMIKVS